MCKAILANERKRNAAEHSEHRSARSVLPQGENAATPCAQAATGGVPLELIAHCAREALADILAACSGGSVGQDGPDSAQLDMVAHLVEAEALPQAGRWHRRDLAAGLAASWNAVLRALRRAAASAKVATPRPPQCGTAGQG